jgi:hypothetical protein
VDKPPPRYPDLLEHAQLLEDSPPHVVIEDPEFAEPAMPTNFAEAFAWIFKAITGSVDGVDHLSSVDSN